MLQTLVLAQLALCIVAQNNCPYGFPAMHNGTCMFYCDRTSDFSESINCVALADLTFATIRDNCDQVDYAARIYGCTIDDLLWPSDCSGYTDCPYCKCSSSNAGVTYELKSYRRSDPTKDCYSCTCTEASDPGISDLVYDCNKVLTSNNAYEWEEFGCPPSECKDDYNNTKTAQYSWPWFEDVSDEFECPKFCYCSPNNGNICETGLTNILASDKVLP